MRARRYLLRLLVALPVVLLLAAVLCLDGVDYRPYLREKYYTEARARLHEAAQTNRVVRGGLSAGFGRALLTPKVNAAVDNPQKGEFRSLPLAGYGSRHGKPAHGVHDDLYVKAVALRVGDRVGVLLGADALIIPPEVTDLAMKQIKTELGLTREQIYLSATHTHASLGGWGEGMVAEAFAGGFQPGVRVWFADRIAAAVREAVADLKPASLGQGRLAAPEFVRNRVVGALGTVDPEFSFLVVKQDQGKLAVLGSYAAHATVLSSDLMDFSADYPGCWQRAMEQETGGLAVFLAGGVGSHSPAPPERGFAGTESMGQALASRVVEGLKTLPLTNQVSFGVLGLEFTLPPTGVRLTDGIRLRPWLARRLVPVRATSFIQAFRLDHWIWFSTPCDFSGELARGIKASLRGEDFNAVVTSFNGDYIGYVIPLKYYHLDGYEPRTMSFFGPNVPDLFVDLIRGLASTLVASPESGAGK
jgi:neutral ceramidase